jgi:hypothetical protein
MACDPTQLLADAECLRQCIPGGAVPAVSLSLLCQLVSGATLGPYVLKAGDTMTGALVVPTTTGLKIGGVTSTWVGLGAVAGPPGILQVRVADNSTYASVQTGFLQATTADASSNTQPVALEAYHETTGSVGGGALNGGVSIDFRADSATADRQQAIRLSSFWTNAAQATLTSELRILPLLNAVATEALRINTTLVDARNGTFFGVAGTQVVSARNTGWTTFGAGASNKNAGALDTGTVTTAQLAQIVKSLMDALILHGLIGA